MAWMVPDWMKNTSPGWTSTLFNTSSTVLFSMRWRNSSLLTGRFTPK